MSGGQQPTFRGFLKASGQTKAWSNKDKKKVDQVHMSTAQLSTSGRGLGTRLAHVLLLVLPTSNAPINVIPPPPNRAIVGHGGDVTN